jgi:hypothetical protein
MRSKYYNTKTKTSDGLVFDSSKEARRWEQLKLLERAGEISELERQVPFELIPAQYETYERYGKNGRRLKDGERCVEKACTYVADFTYVTTDKGELIVEDTKSEATRTKEYVIKRKLMRLIHGIAIREV